jgi:hypothetical protein
MKIITESPWRFITAERVFVTSEDHGHPFGLPAPVDAAARVMSSTDDLRVSAASIHEWTGDLQVYFGLKVYLECLQMSCGYESWRLYIHGAETICIRGGGLAHFDKPNNTQQIAAGNAGWRVQFRLAVLVNWSRVPEL